MFKMFHRLIFILVIGLIVMTIVVTVWNDSKVSLVRNCKVIELQQQQLISGSNNSVRTEIRYLVITNKETFVCENSVINGKFNNSDMFWNLKKDSTYTFKVSGVGKSMLTDYRNILEVVK